MREEDEEEEEEEARLLELEATLISSLSDEMREAYDQLDPEQQIQALEMLRQAADERAMAQSQQQMLMMEQQQLMSRQDQEEMVDLPEEHFLTIALNGEWRQIGGGGRGDTVVFCFVIFFFPFLPSFLPSFLPACLPSFPPSSYRKYVSLALALLYDSFVIINSPTENRRDHTGSDGDGHRIPPGQLADDVRVSLAFSSFVPFRGPSQSVVR
jgi:hypothetical protein